MNSYFSLLKIVLYGRSSVKLLAATILSFTFSIAVILCTFGLMDGFDHLLKSGLRYSSGDLLITNRVGFFSVDKNLLKRISTINPKATAPVIQTEAFVLHGEMSKGVMVRGVEDESFSLATGLKMKAPRGTVVLGDELARQLNVNVGDQISLTFGRGNESASSLPMIQSFLVNQIVKHGIYQKDLRFVYLNRFELAEILNLKDRVNLVILRTEDINKPLETLDPIRNQQKILKNELESSYTVKPFWNEYDFLIEAVKVEKFSISLILQLIVVVAIFNIIAFVIYIMEKKSQEFFFLRAVGLSLTDISKFWFVSVIGMWALACFGAYLLALLFNWSLKNISFLQVPGEIYVLSSLDIKLDFSAYMTVYGISLVWIMLAAFMSYLRLKKRPIMQGLRQEFSS